MPHLGNDSRTEGIVSYRRLFLLALIASVPNSVSAQFTTFIPPHKAKDSVKAAVVAQQRARSDSITAASVTNMRTWVDSAAGVVAPTIATDSMADSLGRAAVESTTFREGSRAPMTASSLPLLLVLGIGSLCSAAILLGKPAERHRA
jgi:hypothetical protein